MKKTAAIVFSFALAVLLQAPLAHAEAKLATVTDLTETLAGLMTKVMYLQEQMHNQQGGGGFGSGKFEQGMQNDDIKKLQELLASDHGIYPEGKITGFFGPLTKDALKRFQEKHGIKGNGEVNDATRGKLEELLKQKHGTSTRPDMQNGSDQFKNFRDQMCGQQSQKLPMLTTFCNGRKDHATSTENPKPPVCRNVIGCGQDDICQKIKLASTSPLMKFCQGDHGTGGWENACEKSLMVICPPKDSHASSTNDLKVKVTVASGHATVTFTLNAKDYSVVSSSTKQADVLKAVANALDKNIKDVNPRLVKEIRKKLVDALKVTVHGRQEKRALDAISRAEHTIAEVSKDIDDADSGVDTSDAEDMLDEAKDLLDDAKASLEAKEYAKARTEARNAENKADDAADLLD